MQSVKDNLLTALRYMLKPLVRLAIKNGVLFPDFDAALRKAYVDVAAKQMAVSKMSGTDEGISLIANIEIQDVRDILRPVGDANDALSVHEKYPMPIILGAWHSDPKYSGPYGVLRDLAFSSSATDSRSAADRSDTFTDLVHAHFPGLNPQVVLDELMRIGAVEDVGNGFYRATRRLYVPDPLSASSIFYVARVVHNLCETIELNLRPESAGGKGLVERSVYTQYGIPKKDHPAFDKFVRERAQAFADDIDNWITPRDQEGIADGMHVGVGFYHYIVNEDDENALSKDVPNSKDSRN
jgi:Family of unknown function (DUF6502)